VEQSRIGATYPASSFSNLRELTLINYGLNEKQRCLLAAASEERDPTKLLALIDEVLAEFDRNANPAELHEVMQVLRARSGD
jgi:hypothetical protein